MSNSTLLQTAGLASGLDWKSLVNELISIASVPITQLQSRVTADQAKATAINGIGSDLIALQTSAAALGANGLFGARTAVSTAPNSSWTMSASSGTIAGNYKIAVQKLATASTVTGNGSIAHTLSPTSNVSGVTLSTMSAVTPVTFGNITVDGQQIAVAKTDSLQNVFDKISAATGGDVIGSYDPTADEVTLTSASSQPIILGATNDTSNFLTALGLTDSGNSTIVSGAALGTANLNAPLSTTGFLSTPVTAVDSSGNGSFSINGTNIAFNINTDSISSLIKTINGSAAAVTASYNQATDSIVLTNNTTGNVGLTVTDVTGGLATSLGLTPSSAYAAGANAKFTLNGGPTLTSQSNTLGAGVTGVTGLSVTVDTADTETVQVTADTASMTTAIQGFITDYNTAVSAIDTATKVTTNSTTGAVTPGVLTQNAEVISWGQSLREGVFNQVSGLTGPIKSLNNIGIDFATGSDQLSVTDTTALNNALANNPNAVFAMFGTPTTGLAATLGKTLDSIVTGPTSPTTGSLTQQTAALTKDEDTLNTQITTMQAQVNAEQTLLTNQFIAMETAEAAYQQDAATLTADFGGSSANTSGTSQGQAENSSLNPAASSSSSSSSSSGSSTSGTSGS